MSSSNLTVSVTNEKEHVLSKFEKFGNLGASDQIFSVLYIADTKHVVTFSESCSVAYN